MICLKTAVWYFFAIESLNLRFIFKCGKISHNSCPSKICLYKLRFNSPLGQPQLVSHLCDDKLVVSAEFVYNFKKTKWKNNMWACKIFFNTSKVLWRFTIVDYFMYAIVGLLVLYLKQATFVSPLKYTQTLIINSIFDSFFCFWRIK